ncbi:amino acid permease [Candidatus Marsarchaeota archaeon]|nr:amino acid permease [Candidatus Marsarchaeota archaeon]MCL5099913.1 amino acid permease [Candidatus Marsarchaeota archaeon]
MINLGAIIGAGIFVIVGIAAGMAGPLLPYSILVAAVIAVLTGLSFSEIASHVAKEGGAYEYAREELSPFMGFIAGIMWTFGNIIAIAAVAVSTGSYINALLGTSVPLAYIAIAAILTFMTVNILGIKNSARTIAVLVGINVAVLLIFAIAGLTKFNSVYLTTHVQSGISGLLAGAAIIFFAFTGFSRVTTVGDEVKNPRRTMPRAIILSIAISTAIYVAVAVVALGLVPYGMLAHSSAPLSLAMSAVHSKALDLIIALGGITATAGVVLTGILGTSRLFFAMGRDRELPRQLSAIDRFSTPINAIIVSAIASIAFVLLVSFDTIVEGANATILVSYFIVNMAALALYMKTRRLQLKGRLIYKRHFVAVPVIGMFAIVMVMAYLSPESLLIAAGILLASIFYYVGMAALRRSGRGSMPTFSPVHSLVREFGISRRK